MHRHVDIGLRQLRQDLGRHLDRIAVERLCKDAGYVGRDGLLTSFATLHWFLLQVLHGNTALTHVSLQARLPLAVDQGVLRDVIKALVPDTEAEGRWRGHRT